MKKTRLVFDYLKKEGDVEVEFCNMFTVGRSFNLFRKITYGYIRNDSVVVITSTRGTKVISKVLFLLKIFNKKPIVYLIVGNQQKLLNSFSGWVRKSIDKVYFEVDSMQFELKEKYNVGFFSNCKNVQPVITEYSASKPIKICYYSEISFRKGFDRIVHALDEINKNEIKYELDVFGFYVNDQKKMENLLNNRNYIYYKGVVKRENSKEKLSCYRYMVFPSRHRLEGVPGAIVDAFEAGLPVVCSDVGFLNEVVKDNYTGFLFNDDDQLIALMNKLYIQPELIDSLRKNVYKELKKYDIKIAVKGLHEDLIEMCKKKSTSLSK